MVQLAIRIPADEQIFLISKSACRWIALNKCPRVCLFGIGEALRRVTGMSVENCVKKVPQFLKEHLQLFLAQKSSIQNAFNALRRRVLEDDNEFILLIDGKSAFISLNRELALKKFRKIYPSIYTMVRNSFKSPSDIY